MFNRHNDAIEEDEELLDINWKTLQWAEKEKRKVVRIRDKDNVEEDEYKDEKVKK